MNKVTIQPQQTKEVKHDPKPGYIYKMVKEGSPYYHHCYIWSDDKLVNLSDGGIWDYNHGFDGRDAYFELVNDPILIEPR